MLGSLLNLDPRASRYLERPCRRTYDFARNGGRSAGVECGVPVHCRLWRLPAQLAYGGCSVGNAPKRQHFAVIDGTAVNASGAFLNDERVRRRSPGSSDHAGAIIRLAAMD